MKIPYAALLYALLWSVGGRTEEWRPEEYECFDYGRSNDFNDTYFESYSLFHSKTPYLTARQSNLRRGWLKGPEVCGGPCTPVYLYWLSRHTIRYPTDKDFAKMDTQLGELQWKMLASGRLSKTVASELAQWQLMAVYPIDTGRVTESGRFETDTVAKLMYQRFPRLLNISTGQFEVRCTKKPRTRETAQAFVRALVEREVRQRNKLGDFDESNEFIDEVLRKRFPITANDPVLLAYKNCPNLEEKANDTKSAAFEQLQSSEPIQAMVRGFAARNGLITLDLGRMQLMYTMCAYEMAHHQYSPWCALFQARELRTLEYLSDVKEYPKMISAGNRISCLVLTDLYVKLKQVANTVQQYNTTRTTLSFSHNGLFKRLVGFLGLFLDFPDFRLERQRLCIPRKRDWRSSLVLPFGANLAIAMYKTGESHPTPNSLKLLTLYNELPIRIPGCRSELCDLEDFFVYYKNLLCNRKDICGSKVSVDSIKETLEELKQEDDDDD